MNNKSWITKEEDLPVQKGKKILPLLRRANIGHVLIFPREKAKLLKANIKVMELIYGKIFIMRSIKDNRISVTRIK